MVHILYFHLIHDDLQMLPQVKIKRGEDCRPRRPLYGNTATDSSTVNCRSNERRRQIPYSMFVDFWITLYFTNHMSRLVPLRGVLPNVQRFHSFSWLGMLANRKEVRLIHWRSRHRNSVIWFSCLIDWKLKEAFERWRDVWEERFFILVICGWTGDCRHSCCKQDSYC